MAIDFRSSLSLTLPVLLLAASFARADAPSSPSSRLRWVSAAEALESETATESQAEFDEPLPTPPRLRPAETELPPAVGGDLAEPPPDLYEATVPEEAPRFNESDEFQYPPRPRHPLHHRHLPHRPLATYLNNRPQQVPLQRDSWLNLPYAVSFLFGGMFISNPQTNVRGDSGIIYGGRLSWDFDRNWGVENRIAQSYPGVTDPTGVNDFRAAQAFLWDLNWHWYWTGDTRWRPYFSAGLGALDLRYDTPTVMQHTTTFTVPFGFGLKYRHSTRMDMRIDIMDNYSFAAGQQEAMHNVSITAGLEARFGGGMRRSYWPWNPGHDWR